MNTRFGGMILAACAACVLSACAGKQLRFEQTSGEYVVAPAPGDMTHISLRAQDSLTPTGNIDLTPILAAEGKKDIRKFSWIAHRGVFMLGAEGFANVWVLTPSSDGMHASYKPVLQPAPLQDPAFTNDDVPGSVGVKLFSGPEAKRTSVIITRGGSLLGPNGSPLSPAKK